jgi:hypothetical protein
MFERSFVNHVAFSLLRFEPPDFSGSCDHFGVHSRNNYLIERDAEVVFGESRHFPRVMNQDLKSSVSNIRRETKTTSHPESLQEIVTYEICFARVVFEKYRQGIVSS